VLATAVLLVIATSCIYSFGLNGPPIRSDGVGYYAYLPAFFIDHDLSMSTLARRQFAGAIPLYTGIGPYRNSGKYLDKYPIGVAMLISPFFLAADLACVLFGPPGSRTGFTMPYQVASVAAGACYACAGLFLLYSALRRMFDPLAAIAALLLITYATNVFHYASYDAIYSHVFSFFLVCALLAVLFGGIEIHLSLLLAGLIFSLIVFTRPSNLIFGILFVPFLLKRAAFYAASFSTAATCLSCFLLGVLPVSMLQLLYWHHISGSWIIYSYGAEGFDWLSSHLGEFLFSLQRGLFLWEPLVPLALIGLIAVPTELLWFRTAILAIVAVQIYLCASWRPWYFGAGFEVRPFVEMMPLLAFPLAAVATRIRGSSRLVRSISLALAAVLVVVNLTLMGGYWLATFRWMDRREPTSFMPYISSKARFSVERRRSQIVLKEKRQPSSLEKLLSPGGPHRWRQLKDRSARPSARHG